jgi:hypothetical protein
MEKKITIEELRNISFSQDYEGGQFRKDEVGEKCSTQRK